MWKSFMMAAGIFACVLGVEMLLVDSAVVTSLDGSTQPRTVTAPDWAPWAVISAGAVTILHFCSGGGSGSGSFGGGSKAVGGKFPLA